MMTCFAAAVGASAYGVFSKSDTVVFGVTLPPGSVPLFVFFALLGGVFALFSGLGRPQCRRCRKKLSRGSTYFSTADEQPLTRAVNRSQPERLPEPLEPDRTADAAFAIEVDYCAECTDVAVLRVLHVSTAPQRDGSVLSEESELRPAMTLSGPSARAWIAHVAATPK